MENKIFKCSSEDASINYEVEFVQVRSFTRVPIGKTWPKVTQCIIKANGLILGVNSVTKHEKDNDNLMYAYINSFNPIKHHIYKEARINLIKQILDFTTKNN